MPAAITITPRLIYKEDLALSTENAPATVSVTVGGIGTANLTPLTPLLLDSLHSYANDAAAAAGGVPVGGPYYSSTYNQLHIRMT